MCDESTAPAGKSDAPPGKAAVMLDETPDHTTELPRAAAEEPLSVCVFDPTPLLTVTIESIGEGDDIHFHAGGQGVWIARMVRRLGAGASLVGCFGGESGALLRPLVEAEGIGLAHSESGGHNGSYVQDRRSGSRAALASSDPAPLNRHEVDDLFGGALAAALESQVTVLAGPSAPHVVPKEFYGRLSADLRALGVRVVADVSGGALHGVLAGCVDVLKVSDEDLVRDGLVTPDDSRGRLRLMRDIVGRGTHTVIVTRADEPALALIGDRLVQVLCPALHPVDHRGAGDAMTAAVAVALARNGDIEHALRLGAAAGAATVARRGLASGQQGAIHALLEHVAIETVVESVSAVEPDHRQAATEGDKAHAHSGDER